MVSCLRKNDETMQHVYVHGQFDRNGLEDLLKRRFYYTPSFSIYGGIAGLYDYGPPGCAVMNNMINLWRSFFILEENMMEVDCTCLTPEDVLKTSGHVARFNDLMVKDTLNGDFYRVDHLIKAYMQEKLKDPKVSEAKKEEYLDVLNRLDNYTEKELADLVKQFEIKAPTTGNDLSQPEPFNLMFATSIGPTGTLKGYLRPETAQGMFTNFKRLLDFNNQKMPFAAAQIGRAFRNEISPRAGLLRVREFTMAEIEHFVNPDFKNHPKFASLADLQLRLFSAKDQIDGKDQASLESLSIAVREKKINNETLGYFLGRVYLFLRKIGIREDCLRFRQHAPNEMAHYASDCWDAEILTSYGWIECVGCADRACYDLTCHSKRTNVDLVAREDLKEPVTINSVKININKSLVGKVFRQKAKALLTHLEQLNDQESLDFRERLQIHGEISVMVDGESLILTAEMVSVEEIQKILHVKEYIPSVIEPSFGLGRILYSLLEHSYYVREEDEQRAVLSLPGIIAPTKCIILPLSNNDAFIPFLQQLLKNMKKLDISCRIDDSSGSIGRRYARSDELGIPFGVTVDFESLKENTVTLRERDSMKQIRALIEEIPAIIKGLCEESLSWEHVIQKYPRFLQQNIC